MKKKLIIAGIALLLIAVIVFGAIYAVNYHKRKAIENYAAVVSTYFETVKEANNQLMSIAGNYEVFSGGFSFETAYAEIEDDIGIYKGVSYDAGKAYEAVMAQEVKYDEQQKMKDIVLTHFEQYKAFENKVLNESEENYGENYGRVYKDWQKPFADEHHKLRRMLTLYR